MKNGWIKLIIVLYAFMVGNCISGVQSEDNFQIKIYMYNLSSEFNIKPAEYYTNNHPESLLGNGIGELIHNETEFVYNTDQYALEQYFYNRLIQSPYFTSSFEEANLFYYPFFPNLVRLKRDSFWLYDKFWQQVSTNSHLFENENYKKYLFIFGGCEPFANYFKNNDKIFNKNNNNEYKKEITQKINMVAIERDGHSSTIVAPYPSIIHFSEHGQYKIDFGKKDILISSSWVTRTPERTILRNRCRNSENCLHLEVEKNKKFDVTKSFEMTSRSIFCLSPPGDSKTRKAFWDALLVGCINVVFDNDVAYPFEDMLDYQKMVIYIPLEKIKDAINILENIPKETITTMQNYINNNRNMLQYYVVPENYENIPKEKDAFDLLIEKLYQKSISK